MDKHCFMVGRQTYAGLTGEVLAARPLEDPWKAPSSTVLGLLGGQAAGVPSPCTQSCKGSQDPSPLVIELLVLAGPSQICFPILTLHCSVGLKLLPAFQGM